MAESDREPGKVGTPWSEFFKFDEIDDIGFTRYYFPARRITTTGATPRSSATSSATSSTGRRGAGAGGGQLHGTAAPAGHDRRRLGDGWVLPYLLSALLLLVACFVLTSRSAPASTPSGAVRPRGRSPQRLRALGADRGDVAPGRMPRLSKLRKWRALAASWRFVSLGYFVISFDNRASVEKFLNGAGRTGTTFQVINFGLLAALAAGWMFLRKVNAIRPLLLSLTPVVVLVVVLRFVNGLGLLSPILPHFHWPSLGVVFVAWAVGYMAYHISWQYPRSGTKPLIHTGGLIVLLSVVIQLALPKADVLRRSERLAFARAAREQGKDVLKRIAPAVERSEAVPAEEVRPLVNAAALQVVTDEALEQGHLAGLLRLAAFLYLWWLAVITFDLTFVWHLYIRSSGSRISSS